MNSGTTISSKPRYEVLDGLCGVAALIVGFLASITVAQLALTFYDKPVRKWFCRRCKN